MFIGNCNVTAELVSLIVAGFLTFLMLYSNPRKTSSYQIIHYGILLSMISIATQLAFFYSQAHTDMFNRELRLFLSLAFLAEYLALLMMLYVYICLLSTRTLHHTKNLQSKVLSFGCTYAIAVFAFAVSGKLPDIIDGLLPLEYYINFYAIFGIITCLICLLSILLNKHSIPKVVNKYALIFIPVDFIMLSVQFMTSNIIFSSLTYVLPFLIYYILFHSNPYDELIGCQNMHSFEARFTDSVSMKRKFLVVYLNFPQLKNVNYAIHNEKVEETAANVCRRIEKLHHMVHIYRFTNDEFAMILYIKDENKIKQFLNNVEMAIIDYMTASSYTINYRIAAIQSNPVVSSTHKLSSMSAYLLIKLPMNLAISVILLQIRITRNFTRHTRLNSFFLISAIRMTLMTNVYYAMHSLYSVLITTALEQPRHLCASHLMEQSYIRISSYLLLRRITVFIL